MVLPADALAHFDCRAGLFDTEAPGCWGAGSSFLKTIKFPGETAGFLKERCLQKMGKLHPEQLPKAHGAIDRGPSTSFLGPPKVALFFLVGNH